MPTREFWKRPRRDGSPGRTYWTNLGGTRVSTGCSTLAAAQRWKAARELERADPRRAASEAATLADAMRDLYQELRRRGRSAATQARAKQKLGHFPRLWGEDCRMSEIDARKVAAYIDARLADSYGTTGYKTPKRITIRDELGFLGQMLKLARRHGIFPHHVEDVMPLSFDTGHKPKTTWCRERDFPRLLRHVTTEHAAHLAWIVATASREAETYRALPEDADITTWRVLVRGSKTEGSWKTIAIPSRLRRWLRFALKHAAHKRASVPLFNVWPNMWRDMKAACVRAGIPPIGPHDLRRTAGKWMRLWGFDLEEIAKFLRHTDPKLAREVYADVDGAELSAVVANAEARIKTFKKSTQETQT